MDGSGAFETLHGKDINDQQGLHLIRVPTVEPVFNPKWFLEQIEQARARYRSQPSQYDR
jgi:hypothetical protein